MDYFGKYFSRSLLLIFILEIFSFFGYIYPAINSVVFIVLASIFITIAIKKTDIALYVILAELFIGSKGYLFFYSVGEFKISIRIIFWLIIMVIWGARLIMETVKTLKQNDSLNLKSVFNIFKLKYLSYKINKWLYVFFTIILWGLIIGLVKNNSYSNIFNDFNAYLYYLLLFVFCDTINNSKKVIHLLQVMFASLVAMSIKTLGLLYLFSHKFAGINIVYRWIRTTGVGEITNMGGDYYRIFFQSHIYIIIGFMIILSFLFFAEKKFYLKKVFKTLFRKKTLSEARLVQYFAISIILVSVILISLSRSFWVGLVGGLFVMFAYYLYFYRKKYKQKFINSFKEFAILLIFVFLLSMGLISNIVKFPWPESGVGVSLTDVMGKRATEITGEAAVGSRWSLLKPLSAEIFKFPTFLIGSGFGSTVTYKSSDPRILEKDSTGMYTTYAFEWGYLDIWLKIGLIGLITYLILLYKILVLGYLQIKGENFDKDYNKLQLILGLLFGLIVLIIVHGFTPYLNHPLGIGYVLVCMIIFNVSNKYERIS